MKIGILSDTHGLLRPGVLSLLQGCAYILHGGDINKPEILETLREIAPVYAVRGNNDKEWAEGLPGSLHLELSGIKFFMVHDKKQIPKDLGDVQIVIFGHSHKYFQQQVDGRLWLNPGSCGPRRFDQEISLALLTLEQGQIHIEKLVLQH